jgi:hypothetical protein
MKEKRGTEMFRETVQKCFAREVITTEQVRLFSRRVRAYILAYHKIRQDQLTGLLSSSLDSSAAASPVNMEKLLKKFKTHRCAMDFDSSFCNAIFKSTCSRWYKKNINGTSVYTLLFCTESTPTPPQSLCIFQIKITSSKYHFHK